MCHIVAAIYSADAVGVAELLTKTKCPLDAVDVDVRIIFCGTTYSFSMCLILG